MKKKIVAAALACVLCVGLGIGGTLAWLTASSETVENTFTVGNIDIVLDESKLLENGTLDTAQRVQKNSFKMVPGNTMPKDPVVTVEGGSEACWLFVKVTKSANLADFITYSVDEANWDPYVDAANNTVANVYYCQISASEDDQKVDILTEDEVSVKNTVTKAMMDAIEDGKADEPTLTFKAAAVQQANRTLHEAYDAISAELNAVS